MPTKKRSNPVHNTPPKTSEKKKKEEEICIICDSAILEDNEDDEEQTGDEAIFCEGLCQGWLHRRCAGLTNAFFQKFIKTNKKFLCVFCLLFEQVSLVEELKEDVKDLKSKLSEVPPSSANTDQVSLVETLKEDVENLKFKFLEVTPGSVDTDPHNMETMSSVSESSIPNKGSSPLILREIKSQITELTTSVQNHQKLLEIKERADRASNLVIVGLKESSTEENSSTAVKDLLREKLDIASVSIIQARRLGKIQQTSNNNKHRPILVTFANPAERKQVLSNRSKLAGTKIYINFDLTKEQMNEEKRLREIRRKLKQLDEFKNKQITIFRNQLYVNRSLITPDQLQAAGTEASSSTAPKTSQ